MRDPNSREAFQRFWCYCRSSGARARYLPVQQFKCMYTPMLVFIWVSLLRKNLSLYFRWAEMFTIVNQGKHQKFHIDWYSNNSCRQFKASYAGSWFLLHSADEDICKTDYFGNDVLQLSNSNLLSEFQKYPQFHLLVGVMFLKWNERTATSYHPSQHFEK